MNIIRNLFVNLFYNNKDTTFSKVKSVGRVLLFVHDVIECSRYGRLLDECKKRTEGFEIRSKGRVQTIFSSHNNTIVSTEFPLYSTKIMEQDLLL